MQAFLGDQTAPKSTSLILPPASPTTYEGWREFVNKPQPVRPVVPTAAQWDAMSATERSDSIELRIIWHSEMPPVEIGRTTHMIRDATRLALLNYRAMPGTRPGFAFDGLGTLGKSTILLQLGQKYEMAMRKKFGLEPYEEAGLNSFLPVVYVTLPGNLAIKPFNQLFIDFYGIPLSKGASDTEQTAAIVGIARECGTSLILIDDIHFLRVENKSAQTVNNHLKYLGSRISATFAYAGIDLEHSGLLLEGNSEARREISQTEHRLVCYEIRPFGVDSSELSDLLSGLERNICLINHSEGDLLRRKVYIHRRTGGYVGAIVMLVKLTANLAIKTGAERISVKLMKEIVLDHAAERHFLRAGSKKSV